MGLWHLKIPVEVLKIGSEACAIDDRIAPLPGEQIIVKKRASAFHGTYLPGFLRAAGVDTVIVTGVKIGRAPCRERVGTYVSISGVAGSLKKKPLEQYAN